jgi:hypothetical protein
MKILLVKAELFHTNGRAERNDEANTRFSQFSESTYKMGDVKYSSN